jgi:hypothetical protein
MIQKNIHIIILTIWLLFVSLSFTHAEMTNSQIAKKYSPSVVTIVALDENEQPLSLGSGFIINEKGDIATNHHVLEGSSRAIIKTTKGDKGTILEVLSYDLELDLLVAKTSLKNIKPLPFGDSDTVTVGEDIIAIGNPAGFEGTVSKGIISGIRKVDDFKFIQITAPISPGSSGGPIFNLSGEVIGIATVYHDLGQSLNFAIPINHMSSLKPSNVKLPSLPKQSKDKDFKKDDSLVQVSDVHYNYPDEPSSYEESGHLYRVDFSIKNLSTYPIRNIQLYFVYKNYKGEVVSYSARKIKVTILPQLILQFYHHHEVKYFQKYQSERGRFLEGKVEIRILDYEIVRSLEASPADVLFK